MVEARFEANDSMLALKVEEKPDLPSEKSVIPETAATCYEQLEPMQWCHLNVFLKECVAVCV